MYMRRHGTSDAAGRYAGAMLLGGGNVTELVQKKRKHYFLREIRRNYMLFIMLIPAAVFFLINSYIPMVGIYYAFTKYDFRGGLFGSPFVGFKNFEFLWRSGTLFRITKNTILYNIVFIFLGNFLQIFVAIILSRMVSKIYKRTVQSIMFLPYFVSAVILGVLFYNLFNYEHGFINGMLTGFGGKPLDVYNTPSYWPFIITLFYLWKGLGYGMVIYLATIMGISEEYYEAAQLDGANIFQQIRHITVPLLKPTFITLLLYALGGIMHGQFDLFYQLVGNNGRLFTTTDIIDTYVFRTLMKDFDVGLGTAAGLYQSVFGFILIMTVNAIVKKVSSEYALF